MSAALGLTEDQLRERRSGIGGSDIPALMGVDSHRTPFDVWMEKTGRAAPSVDNRFTKWGKRLEGVIADEYAERFNVALGVGKTLRHRARPWQVGTPDRFVWARDVGPDLERFDGCDRPPDRGLEIKNKSERAGKEWGNDEDDAETLPGAVLAQCHWYLSLTELPRWDVATLIGGNDFRSYTVARDVETEAALLEVAEIFWRDHVLTDKPPGYDGSAAAWRYLASRLKLQPKPIEPTASAQMLAKSMISARRLIKAAEKENDIAEQKLAALLVEAGASGYDAPGEWRYTLGQRRGNVAWKSVAEDLAAELKLDADAMNEREERRRAASYMAPRFTIRGEKD